MSRNLPSDESERHDRLEEWTVNTDRDAGVRQLCGKRELNF